MPKQKRFKIRCSKHVVMQAMHSIKRTNVAILSGLSNNTVTISYPSPVWSVFILWKAMAKGITVQFHILRATVPYTVQHMESHAKCRKPIRRPLPNTESIALTSEDGWKTVFSQPWPFNFSRSSGPDSSVRTRLPMLRRPHRRRATVI
jgi:hypothetical protein